ncbi:hypothetical protein FGE12_25975 [Aggregicoccus sp. 17bor-14]|uniref:hypothetical protein n=1 Tax=Myxococcaceae TaxID=31 RepID=UPI00129CC1C2|nr:MULTISPECIES: hypothetical protein [Myxococcaceae]MBF5045885.1 hypothetical protein [Simulacricoccus sp. 17bor-14]MRI91619.1 hypothetical protein [Aggregicoccus sp. 17bor-14]
MGGRSVRVGGGVLLLCVLAACGPGAEPGAPADGTTSEAPAASSPPASAPGRTLWAQQRAPEAGAHQGTSSVDAVGTDASGSLHVLGSTSTFAGAEMSAQLVLERLGPQGERLSRRAFAVQPEQPGGLASHWTHLAVSPAGDRFLATEVQGRLDLGGGALTGAALARLGPDGAHAWSRALPAGVRLRALVLLPGAEALVVLGQLEEGSADFGGGVVLREPGPFLARFRAEDGALEWLHAVPAQPGTAAQALAPVSLQLLALAVDATGELAAVGQRLTRLFPEDPEREDAVASPVLVRLSPEGAERWRRDLGPDAQGSLQAVAFWEGSVVAEGSLTGSVRWAGQALPLKDAEAVVVRVRADGQQEKLVGHYPGAQLDSLAAREGTLLLGGLAPAGTDFGTGPVGPGLEGNHPVVVALGPGGAPRFAHLFPTEDPARFWQGIRALTVLADGSALVGGQFERRTDFGTGMLTPVFWDGFLVRLAP